MTQNGQNHHPALGGADTATVITNGTVTHRTTDPGLPVRHTGLPPEARKGALIDSAVTSFGSRRTGADITEKDIVNIGGLDMSIKAALMALSSVITMAAIRLLKKKQVT